MKDDLKIIKAVEKKQKPDSTKLGFGKYFTDHMFIMEYIEGQGWINPRIQPYGPLMLDPAASVLHYGQEVFEGLKAYYNNEGSITFFRPQANFKRMNKSLSRMGMPQIDEDFALYALKELVKADADWVPKGVGTTLYIRPTVIATEAVLGVHASKKYLFYIILSPVGAYYTQGLKPIGLYVEDSFARAAKGGTGGAKTSGNYAASLLAAVIAEKKGYNSVLWLDSVEKKYVEEAGTMNVFFKIAGTVITPPLAGTILPGITRDSVIQLLKKNDKKIEERQISIDEIAEAYENGTLEEAFVTGTAAVISSIGILDGAGKKIELASDGMGETAKELYDELTGIQYGTVKDELGWIEKVI